tara:strand:- start:2684 stop:4234 length:1551 start_codon:yes stop_codon:yes gene_type:complete
MNKEKNFRPEQILLSTTDLQSNIKYANQSFCDVAGYSLEEMSGNPHNMVRHEDMPKAAFKDLWSSIQSGNSWMGPVKNKCKDGDYYWVNAFVTPIKDNEGNIFEYQSVRTVLDNTVKQRAENIYAILRKNTVPKKLKFQTDITFWIQLLFYILVITSAISFVLPDSNFWISIIYFAATLFGGILFTSWRKKYKNVVKSAKEIYENSLMSYLYSGNNDDIGSIELALKMQEARLNAVVGRVSDDSEKIAISANNSVSMGDELSHILNQQNMETDQVATAINQMTATVQDIAKIVIDASESAKEGLHISNKGKENVFKTVEAINKLSEQLNDVSNAINRLIDGTKSIETVLVEISSIADQTNLLALNAAIEAARAGEQGRGFAVVAEEVRALAMRTQESTKEVNSLLDVLKTESNSVTSAMDEGRALSSICVELAKDTDNSLEKIISEVSNLANISTQIATGVEEQSVVNGQVSRNIMSISDKANQTKENGDNAVEVSQQLLQNITEQQVLLSQFKKL